MVSKNETVWTVFILLGFSSNTWTQSGLFVFFFCIFLINLISNLLIITVSITDISLQTPMYFFLSNLSLMDIFSSSTVVPRLLRDLMSNDKTISFLECAAQMYISLCFGTTECILLSAMAYDRYAAICYPLRYTTMMNQSACIKIASATWIFGFLFPIFFVAHTLNLNICANNTIKHFFCDVPGVLALGCGDVSVFEFAIFLAGVILLIIPVAFIITTYIIIISAVLKITSSSRKQKALSTCGSHLMVVALFYISAMSIYMKPRSTTSSDTDMKIAVFYTTITPTLNPLVYTLRNGDVKKALQSVIIKKKIFWLT